MNRLNPERKPRIKRSTWLPTLLLLYLLAMTAYFAPGLICNGEWPRLVIVFLVELGIITLLYFFLKKREQNS